MLALIVPPVAKPCEPLIGAYSLARLARRQDLPVTIIDANLDWFQHQLWGPGRPSTELGGKGKPMSSSGRRLQRALRHTREGNPFRDLITYRIRDRYQQAVEHLEIVLGGAGADFPDQRAGLADFRIVGHRPVSRQDLVAYQQRAISIFDSYLKGSLIPELIDLNPQYIGFSVTFLHQMFATVRMASILRRELPQTPLVLGGALVECWRGADWQRPPFDLFDAVIALHPTAWDAWRHRFGIRIPHPQGLPLIPAPEDILAKPFFTPEPIVPLAFGLGCAWGRCTFCPDYQRHSYQASFDQSWLQTLEQLLEQHPTLTLHLCDSCGSPEVLDRLASVIRERALPVRWYGFARLEKSLLQPGRLEQWFAGGCRLLQFGLETAAPDLLKAMHKGIQLQHAAAILARAAGLGIRNYIYLLFGFPGETHDHQFQTLDFILRHEHVIHYLNNAIFNLPKDSPIATNPADFSVRKLQRFSGEADDLSIYLDFDDVLGSARKRARSFLQKEFLVVPEIRRRVLALPPVFRSNHAIMAGWS